MSIGDYLILVQQFSLILIITCPTWILCKGKKKPPPNKTSKGSGSNEPPQKPPSADVAASQKSGVKEEPKKEEEGVKTEGESKESKEGDKKEGGGSGSADAQKDPSLKPFPKFEMPTESKKNKKMLEVEKDKKEKMKQGFYQQKSDEDDTLEKVDSLHVEQSEKTKRSQKKKNKK
ncbi:hypothetical protein CRE_25182 [Caenorhabditis remanei]|uniref:Uncharacterized protein n=1 Tax=Caenorhabditis remanei TaxID=31234 RepID=E3LTD6_CAERE|nr:hypothetical protein CRE_25182 [Caenorhabditis remanei]